MFFRLVVTSVVNEPGTCVALLPSESPAGSVFTFLTAATGRGRACDESPGLAVRSVTSSSESSDAPAYVRFS